MPQVIGVRFTQTGKSYYFDPGAFDPHKGESVIVETARGIELGEVAAERHEVAEERIVKPLKRTLRVATEADFRTLEQNKRLERDAFRIGEERIARHGLDMKLVSVEYTFDRSKIVFYFSADGRVDFRELVKDLAQVFRTRIELRQIGVRDEAKMIGGLGICGRPLCCCSFMDDFQPVSINMAKEQGLSLNPTKISGTCGRLMCCLKFESASYQQMLKETPPPMSLVDTPSGRGTVLDSNLLKCTCRVRLLSSPDSPPVNFPCAECRVLRHGKDRGEPLSAEAAGGAPAPAAPSGERARRDGPRKDGPARPRNDRPRQDKPAQPAPAPQPPRPDAPAAPAAPAGDGAAADGQRKRRRRSHRGGRGRTRRPADGAPRDSQPREGQPPQA